MEFSEELSNYDGPVGSLRTNDYKKSDRSPSHRGSVQLTKEILQDCAKQIKEGEKFPTIELSGWTKSYNDRNTGESKNFISLSAKKKYVKGE